MEEEALSGEKTGSSRFSEERIIVWGGGICHHKELCVCESLEAVKVEGLSL